MSADCFTLDDYIKKQTNEGSLCMLGHRKREKNIDKEELDASLDDIMRKNAAKRGMKCGISKFDRFNDDSGNQSNDDDDDDDDGECSSGSDYRKSYNKINSDMELMDISENNDIQAENSSIRFAKEIQKMDHPECCRIKKHFTTVESAMGVKIKSQQWRVEPKNLSNDERSNKVLNGRIQKNYKNTNNNGPKAGIFIEKGNFTYKFNDDPSNDSEDNAESIVGIVRNRPVTKIIRVGQNNNGNYNNNRNYNNRNRNNGNNGNPPVNINMNWNGFFKGVTECIKTVATTTQPLERKANVASVNQDIQVQIAATEYLEYLVAKRDNPSKKVSFSPSAKPDPVNEYIVSATAGNGIDMDICPSVTNMPMNLRFA